MLLDVAGYNFAVIFIAKAPSIYKSHLKHLHYFSALSKQLCMSRIQRHIPQNVQNYQDMFVCVWKLFSKLI